MGRFLSLALALTVAACGQSDTEKRGQNGAAAPAATRASAPPPAEVSYKAGDNLVTLKDKAPCREPGPAAGDPWELAKGAYVKFLKSEGSELRVDSGGGIECLVAPDAVGPA